MTGSDAFGRAVRDYYHGELAEPLVQRDGADAREHDVEAHYFGDLDGDEWRLSRLEGPLVDLGAGAGRDALHLQEQFEAVAVEVSDHLVETMRERGVRDARRADMFALRESFGRDRFRSALAYGTQVGLAGSMQGLRRFLGDLAAVTAADATAVFDCFDPTADAVADMLGYRADPMPGLAYRVMHFEYGDEVGETLLFRLFSPDRVREALVGTAWTLDALHRDPDSWGPHYEVALSKN